MGIHSLHLLHLEVDADVHPGKLVDQVAEDVRQRDSLEARLGVAEGARHTRPAREERAAQRPLLRIVHRARPDGDVSRRRARRAAGRARRQAAAYPALLRSPNQCWWYRQRC